jgi:hypothetical protein
MLPVSDLHKYSIGLQFVLTTDPLVALLCKLWCFNVFLQEYQKVQNLVNTHTRNLFPTQRDDFCTNSNSSSSYSPIFITYTTKPIFSSPESKYSVHITFQWQHFFPWKSLHIWHVKMEWKQQHSPSHTIHTQNTSARKDFTMKRKTGQAIGISRKDDASTEQSYLINILPLTVSFALRSRLSTKEIICNYA